MFSLTGCSKYKDDELISCSVSTGGGMLGGHRHVSLAKDEVGAAVLTVREKQTHADREVTTVYNVDQQAFDRVREIVNEYNLYGASKRPRSGLEVLDGDTTTISFVYSQGDFSVPDDLALTPKMSKGYREFISYLDSLAAGEGIVTVEPQQAALYLRSGYTLTFIVEDVFDGRMDGVFGDEDTASAFEDCGKVLRTDVSLDTSGAQPVQSADAGDIVYDIESGSIIVMYEGHDFGHGIYILARLDDYPDSACPLIAEMEGPYSLLLN